MLGSDANARRGGEHEHVGTRWSDRQRGAEEDRCHGDQGHGQYAQPRDSSGPVAQCDGETEAHCDHAEVSSTVEVGAAGAVQRRERAYRCDQTRRDIACGPTDQNGHRGAEGGPEREGPPTLCVVQDEELAEDLTGPPNGRRHRSRTTRRPHRRGSVARSAPATAGRPDVPTSRPSPGFVGTAKVPWRPALPRSRAPYRGD